MSERHDKDAESKVAASLMKKSSLNLPQYQQDPFPKLSGVQSFGAKNPHFPVQNPSQITRLSGFLCLFSSYATDPEPFKDWAQLKNKEQTNKKSGNITGFVGKTLLCCVHVKISLGTSPCWTPVKIITQQNSEQDRGESPLLQSQSLLFCTLFPAGLPASVGVRVP